MTCDMNHFHSLITQTSNPLHETRRILHQASLDLTRERIARTRHQLRDLNSSIASTQTQLSRRLKPEDLDKVQAFNNYTSRKAFQSTKLKQINKFDRLHSRKPTQANQQPPTETTKDTVINLSRHQLTQAEHKVLSLGLNFAVAPKKIPFSDIVQQVEPKLRFLSKAAANEIRLKVTNALSDAKPPKPNLSKEEHSAIQDLRRNQSIHILQADKGNATVVMDQDVYDDTIEDILQDKDTYSKLNRDPTPTNERKINQQLLTLHRSDALPKALYFQLRSSSAKSPIPFGQPKIHKPNTPLRPIISTRGSPCYNTARHLANILQPLVGQTQHHVTNSKHFIDVVSKTKIRPSNTLVSFDVVSLFTSVPVDSGDINIHGGGVFIAVIDTLTVTECPEFDSDCEIQWCNVQLVNAKPLYIGSFYCPPNNRQHGLDGLHHSLSKIMARHKDALTLTSYSAVTSMTSAGTTR
nr:uncharacterized protein LOC129259262 [Lytechinus pictus]